MFSLCLGILGFVMVLFLLAQGTITGNVIGVNNTSKIIGVLGIFLMLISIIINHFDK